VKHHLDLVVDGVEHDVRQLRLAEGVGAALVGALVVAAVVATTLAYLVIAIFAATPVFLSANTSVKFDWINYHPFYHVYMGLKNAYFGTTISPVYYVGAVGTIVLLFLAVRLAFHREIGKEG
jgi:ABC-type polysaccharide/polyol phosphate export permease